MAKSTPKPAAKAPAKSAQPAAKPAPKPVFTKHNPKAAPSPGPGTLALAERRVLISQVGGDAGSELAQRASRAVTAAAGHGGVATQALPVSAAEVEAHGADFCKTSMPMMDQVLALQDGKALGDYAVAQKFDQVLAVEECTAPPPKTPTTQPAKSQASASPAKKS